MHTDHTAELVNMTLWCRYSPHGAVGDGGVVGRQGAGDGLVATVGHSHAKVHRHPADNGEHGNAAVLDLGLGHPLGGSHGGGEARLGECRGTIFGLLAEDGDFATGHDQVTPVDIGPLIAQAQGVEAGIAGHGLCTNNKTNEPRMR